MVASTLPPPKQLTDEELAARGLFRPTPFSYPIPFIPRTPKK